MRTLMPAFVHSQKSDCQMNLQNQENEMISPVNQNLVVTQADLNSIEIVLDVVETLELNLQML